MRRAVAVALLCLPAMAWGGTQTIGIDYGRGASSGFDCAAVAQSTCERNDVAWRGYYGYVFDNRIGIRITHTETNDLRLTTKSDPIFDAADVDSSLDDLTVTYTLTPAKLISISFKGGLARWEERRATIGFAGDTTAGISPAFGISADFGNKLLRAGVSIDVYPSVGDTGYVRYFGAGIRFVW